MTIRISFEELFTTLQKALQKLGFAPDRAALCARLFAETTRDGVYSHGLNRIPRFMATIGNGCVDIHAQAELTIACGALERWDGKSGPGNLNAHQCMERALTLARQHGIGAVALANTNHWMRGGSYGWQAAEAGMIAMCWTNTMPNLPPWGASDPRIGNNPLVIAVPRPAGHMVFDGAISQFSYGALASYQSKGELLPVDGGYDLEGNLTRDPAAIEASKRALPIGFWKGTGLSLALDMIAAMLSGGNATHQIPTQPERESGISQIFIAMNLPEVDRESAAARIADEIIAYVQLPPGKDGRVRYPGERTSRIRQENIELGVPVDPQIFHDLQKLAEAQ
jgi:3-dehydro-L-gulonate 2-dehydrogenase